MQRGIPFVLAGIAAGALAVSVSAPAGAQEFGVLEIDPTEGFPGDVVNAEVPPEVVADECVLEVGPFQEPGTFQALGVEFLNDVLTPAMLVVFSDRGWDVSPPDPTIDPEFWTFTALQAITVGVAGDPALGEEAWTASFALTFADIASQEPVGELSSFDPFSGIGEVIVPDVAPGLWAVVATCLGWNFDLTADTVNDLIALGAAWLEENADAPYGQPFDPANPLTPEIAPTLLGGGLLVPGELWVDLFCVLDADGECPNGEAPGLPTDGEEAPAARAVVVQPAFTG